MARVKLRCIFGCLGLKSSYQEKGLLTQNPFNTIHFSIERCSATKQINSTIYYWFLSCQPLAAPHSMSPTRTQWASNVFCTSNGRLYEFRTSYRRPRTSDAQWELTGNRIHDPQGIFNSSKRGITGFCI